MTIIFEEPSLRNAAAEFWKCAGAYKVFAFEGELGAGKTTFINEVCKLLKVEDTVSSPTYSIIQEYETAEGKSIYHLDLYRLKDANDALEAGVEDCLNSGNICFVEWPQRAKEIFSPGTVFCTLDFLSDHKRKLTVQLPKNQ